MKIKLTLMAVAAMLVISQQIHAITIPVVTNYSRLTVALMVKTNLSLPTVNGVEKWTYKTTKIDNTALLGLLQEPQYANTEFPIGSFLAIGWQNSYWGHVLVMSPNGTNVFYDASANYYAGLTNYIYITFWNHTYGNNGSGFGAEAGQHSTIDPGSFSWTGFNNAYFEISDYSGNTFLYGDGTSMERWYESWDLNHHYLTWSDTESFVPAGADSTEKLLGNTGDTVSGTITATGHGNGYNPIQF